LKEISDNFSLSEAFLVEKPPPGGENMSLSDSVSVTINRASPPAKPINWWLIGGISAAVVVAVSIIYLFFIRRRKAAAR